MMMHDRKRMDDLLTVLDERLATLDKAIETLQKKADILTATTSIHVNHMTHRKQLEAHEEPTFQQVRQ